METKKMLKKSLLYFVPVIIVQIIFFTLDKTVQVRVDMSDEYIKLRSIIIHLEVYFCLFVIPLYLMLANVIYNLKNEINEYYDDIKLVFLSIFISNICVLILNIGSKYIYNIIDINYILEFIMIFVPEMIMTAILSYIGTFILDTKEDEDENDSNVQGNEKHAFDGTITEDRNSITESNLNDESIVTREKDKTLDKLNKDITQPIEFVIKIDK